MTNDQIRDALRPFLARRYPAIEARGLSDSDSLVRSAIIDSLGILHLVGFLEEQFGVALGTEDLTDENFDSIDAMVRLVQRKTA